MPERFTHVSAYMLLTQDDELLLCRLSAQANEPGNWTLPGGGLNFGESPEAGAIREVQEETGLEAEILGLEAVSSRTVEQMHWIRIVYRGRVVAGELRPEEDGSTDLPRWVSPDELRTLPLVELAAWGAQLAFATRNS